MIDAALVTQLRTCTTLVRSSSGKELLPSFREFPHPLESILLRHNGTPRAFDLEFSNGFFSFHDPSHSSRMQAICQSTLFLLHDNVRPPSRSGYCHTSPRPRIRFGARIGAGVQHSGFQIDHNRRQRSV